MEDLTISYKIDGFERQKKITPLNWLFFGNYFPDYKYFHILS